MRNSGENITVIGKTEATTTMTTTTATATTTVAVAATTATTTATTSKPGTMSSTDVTSPSTLVYPTVGRCTYSAMYQTSFQGTKLIRTIYVKRFLTVVVAFCIVVACHLYINPSPVGNRIVSNKEGTSKV
ncbi:unnamed protein product [Angiostrongylus costaricensis]|uniref:Uncharacterized protein n=1 Tax=Angiostrongylus costaricensis TaxID=334426 RepID=A0A0R3PF56_ANGCS|nr:unnamed protein product [Angiostrongylus costaricensis]